jgi:hypothetical protein
MRACRVTCSKLLKADAMMVSSLILHRQVLGTAKNAIVVWIGIVFLGDEVTSLQGGGYALSLAGFFAYNYLKLQQPAGASRAITTGGVHGPSSPNVPFTSTSAHSSASHKVSGVRHQV